MKENVGGNLISYEYLNKVNPDKLYVIDRSNNGTDKQLPKLLHTDIIKNMKAVKINKYINLKPTLGFSVKVVLKLPLNN